MDRPDRDRPTARDLLEAGLRAALLSGAPSTAWALVTRADPLAGVRAAGTLLPRRRDRPGLLAGAVAHIAVSAAWTSALGVAARKVPINLASGPIVGALIAALDLDIIARGWFPAIASLPRGPQWADHIAFGVVLGWSLRRPQHSGRAT